MSEPLINLRRPVLILSDKHREAAYWALQWGLGYGEWRWADRALSIVGLTDPPFVIIDTFWRRPDAGDLLRQLRASWRDEPIPWPGPWAGSPDE